MFPCVPIVFKFSLWANKVLFPYLVLEGLNMKIIPLLFGLLKEVAFFPFPWVCYMRGAEEKGDVNYNLLFWISLFQGSTHYSTRHNTLAIHIHF